jgi:hypothetical protein
MVDVHCSANTKNTISARATGRLNTRLPVRGSTSARSASRRPLKSSLLSTA